MMRPIFPQPRSPTRIIITGWHLWRLSVMLLAWPGGAGCPVSMDGAKGYGYRILTGI
jgi:hypothetical protein